MLITIPFLTLVTIFFRYLIWSILEKEYITFENSKCNLENIAIKVAIKLRTIIYYFVRLKSMHYFEYRKRYIDL